MFPDTHNNNRKDSMKSVTGIDLCVNVIADNKNCKFTDMKCL